MERADALGAAMILLPNGEPYCGPAIPTLRRINRFEERGMRLAAHWPDDEAWARWLLEHGFESELAALLGGKL